MKSSCKLEAKLIGYDETPIDFVHPDAVGVENLDVEESFGCNSNSKVHPTSEAVNGSLFSKSIRRLCPSTSGSVRKQEGNTIQNHAIDTESQTSGTVIIYTTCRISSMEHLPLVYKKVTGRSLEETATSIRRLCPPSTSGSARTHQGKTIQNHDTDTNSQTSGTIIIYTTCRI